MSNIKQTIVNLFELDKISPEKSAEMAERLGKLVFQAVLARILPMLSKEDTAEYERMISAKEEGEAIFKFLSEKVLDFENIIKEESESLRVELAQELASAKI